MSLSIDPGTHCPDCGRTYEQAAKDPKCSGEIAAKRWAEEHPDEARQWRAFLFRRPVRDSA